MTHVFIRYFSKTRSECDNKMLKIKHFATLSVGMLASSRTATPVFSSHWIWVSVETTAVFPASCRAAHRGSSFLYSKFCLGVWTIGVASLASASYRRAVWRPEASLRLIRLLVSKSRHMASVSEPCTRTFRTFGLVTLFRCGHARLCQLCLS